MQTNIHPSGTSLAALGPLLLLFVLLTYFRQEIALGPWGHATDNASKLGDSIFTGNVCTPTIEIHRQVTEVFGDDVTTAQYVGNGADLETGGPNIRDHDRAGTSRFDVNAVRIGELILLNRRVAIRSLSTAPELLIGTPQNAVP